MYLICTLGVPIELESAKGAENQVQNGEILTFHIGFSIQSATPSNFDGGT
jgi:hypothetical protein